MTNNYFDDFDEGTFFYDSFDSLKNDAYELLEERLKDGLDLEECHILVELNSARDEELVDINNVNSIDMIPYGSFELRSVDDMRHLNNKLLILEYKFKKSNLYDAIYCDDLDMEY
tara:strand:- start:14913 stop:15257 length:345 start_codon:yes stop_codon:yes gene_type:complete